MGARLWRRVWVASHCSPVLAMAMIEEAAAPDIRLGPLSLWAIGRLSVPSPDPWWIDEVVCRIVVSDAGVTVELDGAIPSRNFRFFAVELEALHRDLSGLATLDGSDMGLVATLGAKGSTGHILSTLRLWPGGAWTSAMEAEFNCDQSYLSQLGAEVRRVLVRFPVMVDAPGLGFKADAQGADPHK